MGVPKIDIRPLRPDERAAWEPLWALHYITPLLAYPVVTQDGEAAHSPERQKAPTWQGAPGDSRHRRAGIAPDHPTFRSKDLGAAPAAAVRPDCEDHARSSRHDGQRGRW